MTRFLVVPQWQGSASSRAMQLIDGAQAIAGDLPRARTTVIEVPLEAGESLGTEVRRLSSLVQIARAQLEAAGAGGDDHVVTIGGDAGVATTAAVDGIGSARGRHDPRAVVVWFSAHAALLDPSTSPTGAYDSMAAGALIGSDAPVAADPPLLDPARLILAGVRELSEAEAGVAADRGIPMVGADAIAADPGSVGAAVAALAPTTVFVHIALDVLDPAVISGITTPEPFGLDVAQVTAAIAAVRAQAPLSGAALTGFAPASPEAAVDDLGAILRIVGALA